jgi:hypothetical protein
MTMKLQSGNGYVMQFGNGGVEVYRDGKALYVNRRPLYAFIKTALSITEFYDAPYDAIETDGERVIARGCLKSPTGAELAMQPMGEQVGAGVTKTRKLWLILPVGFLLGTLITVSEPDLKVLADQVPSIPSPVLIWGVAIGVGLFLVLALIRMLFGVSLNVLLIVCYALTLVLAIFAPHNFLAVAFDSGGVTTGPMTVPFIMAFGIGISSIRSDRKAAEDSFGLIALCSVGPIMTVMILSLIFHPENADYTPAVIPVIEDSASLASLFTGAFPTYFKEIAISVLPIVLFYFFYRLIHLYVNRMQKNRRSARRIRRTSLPPPASKHPIPAYTQAERFRLPTASPCARSRSATPLETKSAPNASLSPAGNGIRFRSRPRHTMQSTR